MSRFQHIRHKPPTQLASPRELLLVLAPMRSNVNLSRIVRLAGPASLRVWRLAAEWANTKQSWNDAKSREFEQRFLDELFSGVNQAVSNIESLERILTKIRADCE